MWPTQAVVIAGTTARGKLSSNAAHAARDFASAAVKVASVMYAQAAVQVLLRAARSPDRFLRLSSRFVVEQPYGYG
jgi:hypothetical protein